MRKKTKQNKQNNNKQKENTMFKISQELLQVLLNYLATRPFNEVFQIIGEVQKLQKCTDCEKPSETNLN